MEEEDNLLTRLLECPVCFCTLTEDSRVLPCQHTFCLKCLNDIYVKRRGNVLCPECRTVLTTPIELLPRNILLMRLLEGLKSRRNSVSTLLYIKFPTEPKLAKSCPTTPGITTASSVSNFLFPVLDTGGKSYAPESDIPFTARLSLNTENEPGLLSRHSSEQHLSPGIPSLFQRRTSAISVTEQPPCSDALSSSRHRTGLHTSRTTADFTSNSLLPNGPPSVHNRFIEVPSVSFSLADAQTEPRFDQSNWRHLSANRSFPSEKVIAGNYYVKNKPSRSHSHQIPQWQFSAGGNLSSSSRTTTVEVSLPDRSGNHKCGFLETNSSGCRNRAREQPKESRSFIKQWFGGQKQHSNNLSKKPNVLPTTGSDGLFSTGNVRNEERTKKHCFASGLRSDRHAKHTTFECYRCVTPYPARNELELDLHLNDLLYVHQRHSEGWMKATHERTGRNGLIPAAFVERLHPGKISLS